MEKECAYCGEPIKREQPVIPDEYGGAGRFDAFGFTYRYGSFLELTFY